MFQIHAVLIPVAELFKVRRFVSAYRNSKAILQLLSVDYRKILVNRRLVARILSVQSLRMVSLSVPVSPVTSKVRILSAVASKSEILAIRIRAVSELFAILIDNLHVSVRNLYSGILIRNA